MASKLHAAFARNDSRSAASLFSNDAGYEDMTLRAQILGRLAIERILSARSSSYPQAEGHHCATGWVATWGAAMSGRLRHLPDNSATWHHRTGPESGW